MESATKIIRPVESTVDTQPKASGSSELHVSVKTIETHQMRMKEKLALHTAAELRQKAREWLAKSAVNRIREDPESE